MKIRLIREISQSQYKMVVFDLDNQVHLQCNLLAMNFEFVRISDIPYSHFMNHFVYLR